MTVHKKAASIVLRNTLSVRVSMSVGMAALETPVMHLFKKHIDAYILESTFPTDDIGVSTSWLHIYPQGDAEAP